MTNDKPLTDEMLEMIAAYPSDHPYNWMLADLARQELDRRRTEKKPKTPDYESIVTVANDAPRKLSDTLKRLEAIPNPWLNRTKIIREVEALEQERDTLKEQLEKINWYDLGCQGKMDLLPLIEKAQRAESTESEVKRLRDAWDKDNENLCIEINLMKARLAKVKEWYKRTFNDLFPLNSHYERPNMYGNLSQVALDKLKKILEE